MRDPKYDVLFEQVVIYDDDHYYMGGVLAELLRGEGYEVVLVTPEPPPEPIGGAFTRHLAHRHQRTHALGR